MIPDVKNSLNTDDPSPFHKALLTHATSLVKMSRTRTSRQYCMWDLQDQVYRGERGLDRDDIEQATKGKPVKMVVPNTFAQVMTFSSFLFLMFNQNRTFFELDPTGDEDYGDKERDCELIMERDLRHNSWNTVLFQHLLDVGRFGPGILECSWTRKITRAYVENEPTITTYQGIQTEVRSGSEWKEYVKYEGNLIRPVSPYRFFPDTRFPLVDFQKGEFCAAEEEYSKASLRALEAAGEVVGVDKIRPLPNDWVRMRGGETRTNMGYDARGNTEGAGGLFLNGPSQSEGTVLVTKMQIWLVPAHFTIGPNDKKLGPEEFPVLYHLWYANDTRVIRCEPAMWWHNEFGWTVSQFTPDMHQTMTLGLADLIYRLQDVITWHINARITDVRRNMRGRLIVDPQGVDTTSLDGEGDIYLRKSVSKSGVDRWVKQLQMADTTQGHMTDAELLGKMMQVVTGVNDNLMGQYNSGRRSAQEARTVLGGAAGRMKLHGHLIWDCGLAPLGKMMLSNSRQSLSMPEFVKAIGTGQGDEIQQRFAEFKGTPEEVITGDDFFTFDSTLASEKGFMAQSLQDLLVSIVSSDPTAAQKMSQGIDPVKLVEEIQYLRGSGNIKRFRYTPEEQQAIAQQQQAEAEAERTPKPKPPTDSMNYADTPPDIQRQIEQAAGFTPSKAGNSVTTTSANGESNGSSSALHIDNSRHVTIQKPGAKK